MKKRHLWSVECPSCWSKGASCDDYAWPAMDRLRIIVFDCPDCGLHLHFYPGGVPGIDRQVCIDKKFIEALWCKCGQLRKFEVIAAGNNDFQVISICPGSNGCGQFIVTWATTAI